MSVPPASSAPEPIRRSRVLRPVRLSTFLLLMVVVALLIALYAERLREARIRDELSLYRDPIQEGLVDALEEPIALNYADGDRLDVVLKELRMRTTKNPKLPMLPAGVPIYIDPIGLQEAGRSLNAKVKRPSGADTLPLGEHLRRILQPLELDYSVKDGFLMITSKDSDDTPIGGEVDPYLLYRDVLR